MPKNDTPNPQASARLVAPSGSPKGSVEAFQARLDEHERVTRGAYSAATEKAWRSDSGIFADWCVHNRRATAPATPKTIAAFLDAKAGEGRKPATLRRYVASIARLHRAAGATDPTKSDEVRAALRRISKTKGVRQVQARAVTETEVEGIIEAVGASREPRDLRDLAVLLLGRDLLARRSELVALTVEDLKGVERGAGVALIRKSKTDREGEGASLYVSAQAMGAVRRWLKVAKIASGPLFRPIDRWGCIPDRALGAETIPAILRRLLRRAGLESHGVSGHSLRVGMTQDLVAAGVDLAAVMQAGRWKTSAMPSRYAEHLLAGRGAVAQYHRRRVRR